MNRTFLAGGLLLTAALILAACGGAAYDIADDADVGGEPISDPAAGTCLEGTPDCDDTGILDGDDTDAEPTAGMCAEDTPDCVDTVVVGDEEDPDGHDPVGDEFDSQSATTQAEALLGLSETELGPDVRVGRRGEEQMMLTEDYVLGRMTVELDINDMDEWIVTAVTVELPDGPETFTQYLP